MFDLFGSDDGGGGDSSGTHTENGLLGETVEDISSRGYNPKADHLSGYDEPESLNGRVPDASYDHPGPGKTYVEVDSSPVSSRDQEQFREMEQGLDEGDELVRVTEEDDSWF